jgi:GntR family histidine utilization transcriptional repressor
MSGWEAIRDDIRARIAAREWAPGALIPGEAALAGAYGVARATVNRALRDLAAAGLVERRRRAGTRVSAGAPRRAVLSIPVLRAEVEEAGKVHGFRVLSFKQAVPPAAVAARMAPFPGGPLFWIETLHTADGTPFALERRWLNAAAVPTMLPDLTKITVNEWLLASVPYATGEIAFSAVAAEPGDAAALGCAEGAALFSVERVTRTEAGPVTFVELRHAPGYRLRTVI